MNYITSEVPEKLHLNVSNSIYMNIITIWQKACTYSLLDFTSEDMNPEEFCIVVAFSESKAITFRGPIVPSYTEKDFIDWIICYFCVCLRI